MSEKYKTGDIQESYGKLKPVSKVRKPFECRECKRGFPSGSPAYNQSDYSGGGGFPKQTKVCEDCGGKLIRGGTEVKPKKSKPKKPTPEKGCGKDTEYPKPRGEGIWRCGEAAPIVGVMLCSDCKNSEEKNG